MLLNCGILRAPDGLEKTCLSRNSPEKVNRSADTLKICQTLLRGPYPRKHNKDDTVRFRNIQIPRFQHSQFRSGNYIDLTQQIIAGMIEKQQQRQQQQLVVSAMVPALFIQRMMITVHKHFMFGFRWYFRRNHGWLRFPSMLGP